MTLISKLRLPYEPHFSGLAGPLARIYDNVDRGSIRIVHIEGFDETGILQCQFRGHRLSDGDNVTISYV